MTATERGHLSIGEVLSLLQGEFPEVTISKIRFLESQGLIDPERTPSGYRKFYEGDIVRLRWILTQQRDHFLPLKVIKDRLDEVGPSGVPGPDGEHGLGPATHGTAGGGPSPAGAEPSADHEPAGEAASPSAAPGAPSEGRATNGHLGGGGAPDRDPPSHATRPSPAADASHPDRMAGATPAIPAPGTAEEAPAAYPWLQRARAGRTQGPEQAGGVEPGDSERDRTGGREAASTVSMTTEELAGAAGLTESQIEQLERFGLLTARAIGGVRYFGEEAVIVAGLAARFARFGIEARHLRSFKVAAEREVSLYGQVISPLVHHRDPSVGAPRAADALAELCELGEAMHRILAKRAGRELLGGE